MNRKEKRARGKEYEALVKQYGKICKLYDHCVGSAYAYMEDGDDVPQVILDKIASIEVTLDKVGIIYTKFQHIKEYAIEEKFLPTPPLRKRIVEWFKIFIKKLLGKK